MPPRSARRPDAFRHQVVPMVHQQPHLTRRTVELCSWQVWFLQRGASHGECGDRTCHWCEHECVCSPSSSAAPAQSPHPQRADRVPTAATDAGSPRPPSAARGRTARPNAACRDDLLWWSRSSSSRPACGGLANPSGRQLSLSFDRSSADDERSDLASARSMAEARRALIAASY
jgi:hypothetical protein